MNRKSGPRAVFLDRDGVINEVVFRDGRPASPRTLGEFRLCDGIAECLTRLSVAGLRLFVISNQPDLARGLLPPSVLEEITTRILASLPVEGVLVCPHDDTDNCVCRKPKPGMLLQLASGQGINLACSFLIGDSWKDIEAGWSAGCRSILLRRAYNPGVGADYCVESVWEAADIILGEAIHGS